ncbi:hypothetical protein KFK09_011471 [Dendrobium nobile]|uniref:Uncharacterized protein n=1 Tax=Dendrobium nobile TaxID=94219 RepID=A0A8T3BFW0_DENNO|nr:hypothetical protein KFK09_011471 [Dendrobium nobile]
MTINSKQTKPSGFALPASQAPEIPFFLPQPPTLVLPRDRAPQLRRTSPDCPSHKSLLVEALYPPISSLCFHQQMKSHPYLRFLLSSTSVHAI